MSFTLRWGILATGWIAETFSKDLLTNPATRDVSDVAHRIVAVSSSRDAQKARDFLTKIDGPQEAKTYGSYAELVADPDVDIIYVATPHSHHFQNAMLALRAGKHVLCEKALTVTAEQARRLVATAREKNLFFMEAVWTRYQPLSLKFYDLTDALTHLATGNETRSYCSTVCKQGFVPIGVDGSEKGWQEDFLNTIGLGDLTKNNFERLGGADGENGKYLSAGELVGHLSKKAAEQLGLPEGIAIGSGVIDAYAGWIGTVGAKIDEVSSDHLDEDQKPNHISQAFSRLAAVAGTSTCHIAMSKDAVFVPGVWGPYRDVLIPGHWLAEGGQSATGELLRHVVDIHPAYGETNALAQAESKNIYEYLNSHLAQMVEKQGAPTISHLGRHFFLYGDLWGNRSPVADANMKGAIIGLSSDKSTDNLALWYYGVMEFIAMQTRQIIEEMNKAGHVISSIFMSGSQCQNPVLMDLLATTCDMPVLIPRYVNAAVVHGAAMLGAKAGSADEEGRTEGLWSIMDRMSKPGRLVKPGKNKNEKTLLDAKYGVFLEQCRTQQEYRKKVDEALSSWPEAQKT
ncbi:hypothetical protein BN1708_011173 [Verticillium longisporum]|uniref:Gfo/Idh/MocA-like oxidoreductase N-terminal domain-containing protein n=1 Tax=Verticillium longisporum TaxID=100787 RepID=A0A0G4KXZ9_VERLO|nr:hypothetical protein BN1708_011173 [Verticillium longisporum]